MRRARFAISRAGEWRAQNWKYKNSSRCHIPNSEIASARLAD
jgi:hypothetical protein